MKSLALFLALVIGASAQFDPNFKDGRNVIVHLFEWPWNDIAEECERFLGPYGFGGVQISPPNEHISGSQWWTRYQPVTYYLNSRSGSDSEFRSMVSRCNAVNVNIYADVVINHMAAWSYNFPGVPYGSNDFNVPLGRCSSYNGEISNYGNVDEVRNCNLVGLNDLQTGSEYVRGKIADFLNSMTDAGVAGFRVDAAKHMWPGDMSNIVSRLNGNPYVFQEVIDQGGEPITSGEYTSIGDVTEFKYCSHISNLGRCSAKLADYSNFGQAWGLMHSDSALAFVDNHDNQRSHGGGGDVVTYKESVSYKRAVAFMLAWDYGTKRIMSSYSFGDDTDQGPPGSGPTINGQGTCDGGWVCEHRWRQIRNMVGFSKQAGGHSVQNWWSNGNNQISFSRGNQAFFAMTCEGELSRDFTTGLPDGNYCDVISGDPTDSGCTGTTVSVSGGRAYITVPSGEDSMVAIHVGAMSGGGSNGGGGNTPISPPVANPTSPPGSSRTVIFIKKTTSSGQDMFIQGGIDHARRQGCNSNADSSACAIPITHRTSGSDQTLSYRRLGDDYLDWYGSESDQTSDAVGTPLVWTTNNAGHGATVDQEGYGYFSLNTWGDHYWMLDVDMDCSKTENGWFEIKGYVKGGQGWESDRAQSNCGGSAGGSKPYSSGNHFALCGFINKFDFEGNSCEINYF